LESTLATYVLVHDAGHGGWCYQPVVKILRAQGHLVYAPTLTGLAERAHLMGPQVDLQCHIRDIVALLRYEDLWEVILVGHGYGGMVITGAADRLPAQVGHLVYLDASPPANGQSLSDLATGAIAALRRYVMTVGGVQLCHPAPADVLPLCGVTDPAMLEWMIPRLTPHPWRCFEQPLELTNEATLRTIPQSHITSTLGTSYCDIAHLRDLAEGRMWELRTGHDMMLTEPDWIADKLSATAEWLPRCHTP
jgi:pimeloyl-ACP methyl ester carboxylesterase